MHILAIFDNETARPPNGISSFEAVRQGHRCSTELERRTSKEWSRQRTGKLPYALPIEDGINWALTPSPTTHYACKDGIHALLAGDITEWPGLDMVSVKHDSFIRGPDADALMDNDASVLLRFYDTIKDGAPDQSMSSALHALSVMRGKFAWVIYDAGQRRVLMARDRDSQEPLYWGLTPAGSFMVGSRVEDLDDCMPTATLFPAGSLFTSAGTSRAEHSGQMGWVMPGDPWPGQVRSFVIDHNEHYRRMKAVPRITSKGAMCGAVYRVASEQDLARNGNAPVA